MVNHHISFRNILKILADQATPIRLNQLKKLVHINNAEEELIFTKIIQKLALKKEIEINDQGMIKLLNNQQEFIGTLSVNRKGFGFIKPVIDNKQQNNNNNNREIIEYFVNKRNLNNALDGDKVTFILLKKPGGKYKAEAKIIGVIERSTQNIVGVAHFKNNKWILTISNPKLRHYENQILDTDQLIENNVYVTKLVGIKNDCLQLKPALTIGSYSKPGNDILTIAYEKNIRMGFNDEINAQLKGFDQTIVVNQEPNRIDITDLCLVTIDGDDSKDFDDAVYVEKLPNQNWRLVVAIADVSYYVTKNSPLDQEALLRGCSVYLINQVIPMLPELLSNNLCSLVPNQVRLSMVCDMEINHEGKVVNHKVYPAYMKSHSRLTYSQVNKLFNNQPNTITDPMIKAMLFSAKILYDILWREREVKGVVDFQSDEPKFTLDDNGKVLAINLRTRAVAEQLIECFMIKANETVAETISKMELPFVYRVHEAPRKSKLWELSLELKGFNVDISQAIDDISPKAIQQVLQSVANTETYGVISTLILRSMEKARYDINNLAHFGLASSCYTHFTSPIRRYPDLIVHRALKDYLNKKTVPQDVIDDNALKFKYAAELSTQNEIKSVDCEREVDQMKKAEYMEQYVKQKYHGIVSGVTKFGVFVALDNTVEGLIRIPDLTDDYYEFDEKTKSLVGKRKHRIFKIGMELDVIVKAASKLERVVDFILA